VLEKANTVVKQLGKVPPLFNCIDPGIVDNVGDDSLNEGRSEVLLLVINRTLTWKNLLIVSLHVPVYPPLTGTRAARTCPTKQHTIRSWMRRRPPDTPGADAMP
jgi:hypothetical protein